VPYSVAIGSPELGALPITIQRAEAPHLVELFSTNSIP
jgi:hypothetical protein